MPERARIGDILVRRELVDPNTLRRAIAEQAGRGQRLVSMLITQTLIELDDGALALSEQLDYPAVLERDLEGRSITLAPLISPEQGRLWVAIPIAEASDGTLVVAARDPSPALAAAIRETVGMPVALAIGPAIYIERIVRAVYKGAAESKIAELAGVDDVAPAGWGRKTVRELLANPPQARAVGSGARPVPHTIPRERSSRNEAPTQPPPMGRTAQSFDAPDDTLADPPKSRTTTGEVSKGRTITANRISRDQLGTKPPPEGRSAQSYDSEEPAKSRTSSSAGLAGKARITTRSLEDTKPPPMGRTAESFDADPSDTNQGMPVTRPPASSRTSTSAALAGSPLITSRAPAPTVPPMTVRTESFDTDTDTHMLPGLLRPPATIPDLVSQPLISTASTIGITPPAMSRSVTRDIEKALSKQSAEKLVVKHLAESWESVLVVSVGGDLARAVRGHGSKLQDKITLSIDASLLLRLARDTGSIAMETSEGSFDPMVDLVGVPASAAPVIVDDETVAVIAAGEPIGDLAAAVQEVTAMAGALAGAYRRFR